MATITTTYVTINGMLMMEDRGGLETYYTPDPLGNLVECRNSSGSKTYEAEYWPYGEVQAFSGVNPSSWGFLGLLGYLIDTGVMFYVRARYYLSNTARWLTRDPIWPKQRTYIYADDKPVKEIDPLGLIPWKDYWEIIRKCGPAVAGAIMDVLLNGGNIADMICKIGAACLGALIGILVTMLVSSVPGLGALAASCIGGFAGGIATSLLNLICDPIKPGTNLLCKAVNAILLGLYGCLASLIGQSLEDNEDTGASTGVGEILDGIRNMVLGPGGTKLDKNCEPIENEGEPPCRGWKPSTGYPLPDLMNSGLPINA